MTTAPGAKLSLHPPLAPMEALSVDELPKGDCWQYEPKWHGFRCLAFRDRDWVALQSKSGKMLTPYFPELVEAVLALEAQRFCARLRNRGPLRGIPLADLGSIFRIWNQLARCALI